MQKPDELELNSDRSFQSKLWRTQRLGWLLMIIVIVAALVGLTGKGGPLASNTLSGTGGTFTYPRVARWQSADELRLKVAGSTGGTATIELGTGLIDALAIERINPEPIRSVATAEGQRLEFEVGPGPEPKEIIISIRPSRPGWVRHALVRPGSGSPVYVSFLVLP
ncbi:hypothetical protein [Sphingosinicella rhizophila]|uniref:Uncharacterized protein n=1 Tax=Sphingosinicella rhizophila TaxID=3050082 RepID=A0ABU3Q5M9_9SPHN|nr:hypothetical protein [Sphingosinicella sp. GR2756]MDT9598706.1 hypothetical protein [Sphingosinicella sp. GR2756]